MTATENQELIEVFNRVRAWPLPLRITLARRILETADLPAVRGAAQRAVARPGDRRAQDRLAAPHGRGVPADDRRRTHEEIRMNRVLLDTNVILDALLERQPWAADARLIWAAHLEGRLAAHVTATSLTDIFYVARRCTGSLKAWQAVRICLDQLYVIPVGLRSRLPPRSKSSGISRIAFRSHRQTPRGSTRS